MAWAEGVQAVLETARRMHLTRALDDFLLARDRGPRTEEWYAQKLGVFFAWVKQEYEVTTTEALLPVMCQRFLRSLVERPNHTRGKVSSLTVHGYARTIRAFLYFGVEAGWAQAKDVAWLKRGMPRQAKRLIQTFSKEDVRRLLRACEAQPNESLRVRDKAIVLLLLDSGIRATELLTLTLRNTELGYKGSSVTVIGKGDKQRKVGPLGHETSRVLIRYIESHRHPAEGVETLIVTDDGQPLHRPGLDTLWKRLKETSGITGVRVSPHTARHTFAVRYLAQPGADIYKLRLLLGHTDVHTTEVYLQTFKADEARQGKSVVDGWL